MPRRSAPSDAGWSAFSDLIDDGSMPHFGIRLLSGLRSDGEPFIDWEWHGEDVQAYWAMGAMFAAALEMFHDHAHENEDPDED